MLRTKSCNLGDPCDRVPKPTAINSICFGLTSTRCATCWQTLPKHRLCQRTINFILSNHIDSNPYAAPLEPCNLVEPTPIAPSRSIRWRVIPVTILYLFPFVLILGSLYFFGLGLFRVALGKNPPVEFGSCIFVVPGFLFLCAGRKVWNGFGKRSFLITLLAFTSHSVCAAIAAYYGW